MKKSLEVVYYLTIIIVILVLLMFFTSWDDFRINVIMFATLKRGIISQNCFWWKLNDYLPDATGAEVYINMKKKGRFAQLNIMGKTIYLLTSKNDIKQLLELSPNPFGPGVIKNNFFRRFIPNNVGVGVNPEWKYKREYNDIVLETDKQHVFTPYIFHFIQEQMNILIPRNFEMFSEMAKQLTSKIIFGTYEYNPIIYKVFKQADSFLSAVFNINTVNPNDLEEYRNYLEYQLNHPNPNTLLSLGHEYHSKLPLNVLVDQIPHWIFPIAGVFAVHLPRLLALLVNHPSDMDQVRKEIHEGRFHTKDTYIRKCILELFRLNNAVNSTFRGLTDDFMFHSSDILFEKGTEFVFFNNPILRDLFDNPNQYIPSRWTLEKETDISALMFNQGNQRCPGKELTISLLTLGLVSYLRLHSNQIHCSITFSKNYIPYIINPCTLEFS